MKKTISLFAALAVCTCAIMLTGCNSGDSSKTDAKGGDAGSTSAPTGAPTKLETPKSDGK